MVEIGEVWRERLVERMGEVSRERRAIDKEVETSDLLD